MSETVALTLNALLCVGVVVALFIACRLPFRLPDELAASGGGPGRTPGADPRRALATGARAGVAHQAHRLSREPVPTS